MSARAQVRRLRREAANFRTDTLQRWGVRIYGVHPASRSGITRFCQAASTVAGRPRPLSYVDGFCLRLPGDRAVLVTYSDAVERLREFRQRHPRVRYYTSRWPVAYAANRLPWTCWCDLVDWALAPSQGRQQDDPDGPWGWLGLRYVALPAVACHDERSMCRRDAVRTGTCYCGKVRTREVEEAARGGAAGLAPGGVVVEP